MSKVLELEDISVVIQILNNGIHTRGLQYKLFQFGDKIKLVDVTHGFQL